ncbi:hypothetical protein [Priestia megaterium]|uniref:hypothetical protein n=1 Tax=Priestia megaterium TaxID=1404 RepID=UPI0025A4A991|nr:hypothetical protein [Priestia megaterium]MDM8149977.1 hypothetical protein [Priestia megaterium]
MKKRRRNIVEDGLTKENLAELKVLLGGDDHTPVEWEDKTEQDFYDDLKNWEFAKLPKQVQIHEMMMEEGITEGHPMYEEMISAIQDIVDYEVGRYRESGGTGTGVYNVPITREEYIVWFHTLSELLQDTKVIPKEYRHLADLF